MNVIKTDDNLEAGCKNSKSPLISVIICAYSSNRFGMTIECINSIFNNTYKNYEIILVIDGNNELKHRMDEKFEKIDNMIIIENEKNEGPSISRNLGVEYAKGDIVAFIDDDAFATKNWLENIIKDFLEYPEIFAVGGKLLLVYETGAKKLPEELLWLVGGTYKGHPENKQLIRNVFTGNMAVKRDIFKDTNFEIMIDKKKNNLSHQLEDTLFCVRLNNRKSGTVLYDPEIIAYHHVPNDRLKVRSMLKRAFDEGVLKAKLEDLNKKSKEYDDKAKKDNDKTNDKTLSSEHSYLNTILISIIKSLLTFKIRNCTLMSLTVLSVSLGYAGSILKARYLNIR